MTAWTRFSRSISPNRPKSRPGFTAFVALCAFAGLRRGEALGVQVGDIDFLTRTLRVKRQIQRAKSADIAAGKDLVGAVAGITVIIRPPKVRVRADDLPARRTGHDPVRTRPPAHAPRRTDSVAVLRRRPAMARQPRRLPLALHPYRRGCHLQAPRTAPLLRLGAHRGRMRRRHRATRPRPFDGDHDAEHLQPPLADRRGPHPSGCQRPDEAGVGITRRRGRGPRWRPLRGTTSTR